MKSVTTPPWATWGKGYLGSSGHHQGGVGWGGVICTVSSQDI